jgi:hypothetical protein
MGAKKVEFSLPTGGDRRWSLSAIEVQITSLLNL